jgi:hypothetical protein
LEKEFKTFEDARENCKKRGGKLYGPKTVVEFRDTRNLKFPGFSSNHMWIGITDIAMEKASLSILLGMVAGQVPLPMEH